LIGLILRGPRIVVSLHVKKEDDKKEDDKKKETFYLTAHMVGGKEPYSWLVDGIEPLEGDQKQEKRSIEDMITSWLTEYSRPSLSRSLIHYLGKLPGISIKVCRPIEIACIRTRAANYSSMRLKEIS